MFFPHKSTFVADMVFSAEDKAVIENDYVEKGWTAYKIWKEHPTKNWTRSSVQRLIKKYERNRFYET